MSEWGREFAGEVVRTCEKLRGCDLSRGEILKLAMWIVAADSVRSGDTSLIDNFNLTTIKLARELKVLRKEARR